MCVLCDLSLLCVRFLCSVLHMQYHVLSLVLIQRYYNVIITEEFFQPKKEKKHHKNHKEKKRCVSVKREKDLVVAGKYSWWFLTRCISHLPQQEDENYLHQTDSWLLVKLYIVIITLIIIIIIILIFGVHFRPSLKGLLILVFKIILNYFLRSKWKVKIFNCQDPVCDFSVP